MNRENIRLWAPFVGVAVLTISLIFISYRYDNKYTWGGVQPSYGVLALDVQRQPLTLLIDGWELYRDRLLCPDDFKGNPPIPDEFIFIGQYGGFEYEDMTASAHGSATYRLTLILPPGEQIYMLELPEIFSAYRLYINDEPSAFFGEPEKEAYKPETGNSSVVFQAEGRTQILVAVSDFSHVYSGMVYPPAFGTPEAVTDLLNTRLVFRMLICVFALTVGMLSLLAGSLTKGTHLTAWYGLLCLSYIGYAGYPVVKTMFSGGMPWYTLERFCFAALLASVMLLQSHLCGVSIGWRKAVRVSGGVMCVLALLSGVVVVDDPRPLLIYSGLISLYKYGAALYLTAMTVYAVYRKRMASRILLSGVLVFDCALVMDRILPLFEPIRFGWPIELAGFCMVITIGAAISVAVAEQYHRRLEADERAYHVSKLMEIQRGYYPMMAERINEIKVAEHDLRHHMAVVQGLVNRSDYQRLAEYVAAFQGSMEQNAPLEYCGHYVANVILHHFASKARELGVKTTIATDIPVGMGISDADICAFLSNLLENALDACACLQECDRWMRVTAAWEQNMLVIEIENSFDGFIPTSGQKLLSRKQPGREGIGLASVRSLARKYGGDLSIGSDDGGGVFRCSLTLPTTGA